VLRRRRTRRLGDRDELHVDERRQRQLVPGSNWGGAAPSGTVGTLSFPALACSSSACPTTTDDVSGLTASTLSVAQPAGMGWTLNGSGSDPLTLTSGLSATASTTANVETPVSSDVPIVLGAANTWTLSGGPVMFHQLGDLSGDQSLTVNMPSGENAELNLSGASDEVGAVTLNGGDMFLGTSVFGGGGPSTITPGDLNGTNGNGVAITNGGLLDGAGTVGALTTTGSSSLQPGAGSSLGVLSATSVTLDPASVVDFDIEGSGTSPGTDYDQLTSTGAVNLAGAHLALFAMSYPAGQAPQCLNPPRGTVYTLVSTTGSLGGTFAGLPNNALDEIQCGRSPAVFRINYQETGATQTVTATAISVFTWSGAAATGQDWSAAANWASGTAPAPSGNVDVLQFPALNGCKHRGRRLLHQHQRRHRRDGRPDVAPLR